MAVASFGDILVRVTDQFDIEIVPKNPAMSKAEFEALCNQFRPSLDVSIQAAKAWVDDQKQAVECPFDQNSSELPE